MGSQFSKDSKRSDVHEASKCFKTSARRNELFTQVGFVCFSQLRSWVSIDGFQGKYSIGFVFFLFFRF